MDDEKPQHDERGRFVPGNRGGPGRPRGHRDEVRRAAEGAVTPELAVALVRRAIRMGLEGNLSAIRFAIDRGAGKVTEAPPETVPIDIELPELRTTADCMAAMDRVIEASLDGTCDRGAAKFLRDTILARVQVIGAHEHEQRLTELEKHASMVQPRAAPRS